MRDKLQYGVLDQLLQLIEMTDDSMYSTAGGVVAIVAVQHGIRMERCGM